MDTLLQLRRKSIPAEETDKVSILVLMDTLLQPRMDFSTKENAIVSILVLMDTLLQQERKMRIETYLDGFNPCFNGYTTSTSIAS